MGCVGCVRCCCCKWGVDIVVMMNIWFSSALALVGVFTDIDNGYILCRIIP